MDVAEIMSSPAVTVSTEATLREAIATMTDVAQHQPARVREVRERLERKDEWTD